MEMMMDEAALRKRIDVVYAQMRERAKPKRWKTGKRAGKVRVPGIVGLPFTRQELWDYAVSEVGLTSIRRCRYCDDIGRSAFPINLTNCVFDHRIAIKNGGGWELSNLRVCCADCNRIKGEMNYYSFIQLMRFLEAWPSPQDRAYVHACLRTHGVSQRLRFAPKKAKGPALPAVPSEPTLALADDF